MRSIKISNVSIIENALEIIITFMETIISWGPISQLIEAEGCIYASVLTYMY